MPTKQSRFRREPVTLAPHCVRRSAGVTSVLCALCREYFSARLVALHVSQMRIPKHAE